MKNKTIEKTLSNLEIMNFIAWFNLEENQGTDDEPMMVKKTIEKLDKCSTSFKWNLRKNMAKFMDAARLYEEAVKELQEKYASDEKSEDVTIVDENNQEHIERRVRAAYIEEFQREQYELLSQTNDVKLTLVHEEDFMDNNQLDWMDLDMLSIIVMDEDDE